MSVEAISTEGSEESYFSDLDRGFFMLADSLPDGSTVRKAVKKLIGPLHFDSTTAITQELATRILVTLGLLYTAYYSAAFVALGLLTLSTGSRILRKVGQLLQHDHFTHIRGSAPERSLNGQMKACAWNLEGDDLHYNGDFVHWTSRLDTIVSNLEKEDADLVILQEVTNSPFLEALVSKLKNRYAHFYGYVAGKQLILSKAAVNKFSYTGDALATIELKGDPQKKKSTARVLASHSKQPDLMLQSLEKENTPLVTVYVYSKDQASSDNRIDLVRSRVVKGRTLPVVEKNVMLLESKTDRGFHKEDRTQVGNDLVAMTIRGLR